MTTTISAENSANRKNYTKEKLEEILSYLKSKNLEKTSPYHQFKELLNNYNRNFNML